MKTQKNQVLLHGEAFLFPSQLPADAVEVQPTNSEFHIIADSETTGNHHVIDAPGVKFFTSNSTTYVVNKKATKVRCVHPDRHSAIDIAPGVWEVGIQQEYDHFAQNLRNVRD